MRLKKRISTTLMLLALAIGGQAQKFFNLTADEVRIDSVMPIFKHTIPLPANYQDSTYQAEILYPEYIEMSSSQEALCRKLIGEHELQAEPVVSQYIGIDRKRASLHVMFAPVVYRDGRYMKLVSFMIKATAKEKATGAAASGEAKRQRARANRAGAETYSAHSLLQSGRWVKIRVGESGFYQLTPSLLKKAGFADISKVRVYGYGGEKQPEKLTPDYLADTDDLPEVPTCLVGDRKVFYAKGPVGYSSTTTNTRERNPYSDYGYYFITDSQEGEPTVLTADDLLSDFYPQANDYFALDETDNFAWYHAGRNLYDSRLMAVGTARNIQLPAYSDEGQLTLVISFDETVEATVSVNGQAIGTITTTSTEKAVAADEYAHGNSLTRSFNLTNLSASNTITITPTAGGNIRMDYALLRSNSPKQQPSLATDDLPLPEVLGTIDNQDLHADSFADMIIIVPESENTLSQAQRLKELHEQKDGLSVRIVRADRLYNEFSSGTPDANAYRRYMKMLYDRADTDDEMPKYLLLFGDGAYDNRMLSEQWRQLSPKDFLLCYESENSFSATYSYVTDDYFTMLDDNEGGSLLYSDKGDVAVGRLPARNSEEARILVDKIYSYRNNEQAGDWQNTICFMGDDGNHNRHMSDCEKVIAQIQTITTDFDIKRIYWDVYNRVSTATGHSYPEVTQAIKEQMQKGALIMNYTGHGAPYSFSHEYVVRTADFAEHTSLRLPLWITASCDISPFDTQETNIGETAMLNTNGGAIVFYGTARTVYSDRNLSMNRTFMKHLMTLSNNQPIAMGEAARRAKNELVTEGSEFTDRSENKLQYVYLGDPALALAMPTRKIVVDKINGADVEATQTPKVAAGTPVTIEGHIEGDSNFKGTITATVKDALQLVSGKLNNPESATDTIFTYYDRINTLYHGTDSVDNSHFTITFALPADMSSNNATGLICLYANDNNTQTTAHGYTDHFTMEAMTGTIADQMGPSVYCYLNTPSFTNGDKVNSTPYFHADISDQNGINSTGTGFGHDIELIIDNSPNTTYSLNSYFQYDFGDYRAGSVGFTLPELSDGWHKLLFRVWDLMNNSSTSELQFLVAKNLKPHLASVATTVNPATTHTTFLINHDRTGQTINVALEVFDAAGRLLWHHNESGVSTTKTYTVDWDLTTSAGQTLQTGVYFYRASVSTAGSKEASKAEKLIVIRK